MLYVYLQPTDVTDNILKFLGRPDKSNNKKFNNSLHILEIYRSSLLSFKKKESNKNENENINKDYQQSWQKPGSSV